MGTTIDRHTAAPAPNAAELWASAEEATEYQRRAVAFALLGDNVRRRAAPLRKNKHKVHRADCRIVLLNLQERPEDYDGFGNKQIPEGVARCPLCHRPPHQRWTRRQPGTPPRDGANA